MITLREYIKIRKKVREDNLAEVVDLPTELSRNRGIIRELDSILAQLDDETLDSEINFRDAFHG